MSYDSVLDLDGITLQDCENMANEGFRTVINDGHVVDFVKVKGEKKQ